MVQSTTRQFQMHFPDVLINFPNSKVCLLGEWCMGLLIMPTSMVRKQVWVVHVKVGLVNGNEIVLEKTRFLNDQPTFLLRK